MKDNLNDLWLRFKELENELQLATDQQQKRFNYTVQGKQVYFRPETVQHHESFTKKLQHYFRDAKFSSFITTPVILSCIIPVVLADLWATFYQTMCFPAYGIPKVVRRDYIILDRSKLRYLNSIERLNCAYCGYVNGAIAYFQEVAGRTEQHWCPIKHAFRVKTAHSRYAHFLDYGDAEQYRRRIEAVRRAFDDLKNEPVPEPEPKTNQQPRGFSSQDFEHIR